MDSIQSLFEGCVDFVFVCYGVLRQRGFWLRCLKIFLPTLVFSLLVWFVEMSVRSSVKSGLYFIDHFIFDVSSFLERHKVHPAHFFTTAVINILPVLHLSYLRLHQPRSIQKLFCYGIELQDPRFAQVVEEAPFPSMKETVKGSLTRVTKLAGKLFLLSIFSLPISIMIPVRIAFLLYLCSTLFDRKFNYIMLFILTILSYCTRSKFTFMLAFQNSIRTLLAANAFLRELLDPLLFRKFFDKHEKRQFLRDSTSFLFPCGLGCFLLVFSWPILGLFFYAFFQTVTGTMIARLKDVDRTSILWQVEKEKEKVKEK